MKTIVVLSGKGGVGKSSITASLAVSLREKMKLVLVDADADCPDLYLLFDGKVKLERELQASEIAKVDLEKCIGCGNCVNACKYNAIKIVDGKAVVNNFFCEGCKACSLVCPTKAIKIVPETSGIAKLIETNEGFPLIYGQLYPGKSGSGKIVHDIRNIANEVASEKNAELTLIDSAAGIGCPIISSITGADYVIGIVEPTQTSISDLERALEVVGHFGIEYGVVLNKKGISEENEKRIRERWGDRILAEIPYSPEVPRALAMRKPPITIEGPVRENLLKVSEKILHKIK